MMHDICMSALQRMAKLPHFGFINHTCMANGHYHDGFWILNILISFGCLLPSWRELRSLVPNIAQILFVSFELANISEALEQENTEVVLAFYGALASGNAEAVQGLLASDDLEWRFYGPPSDQYLMQFLTGAAVHDSYVFNPVSARAIGDRVFAEGKSNILNNSKCWVHVWTVKAGKITQLREYFNTALTVVGPSTPNSLQNYLWESQLGKSISKSIPSLILAI